VDFAPPRFTIKFGCFSEDCAFPTVNPARPSFRIKCPTDTFPCHFVATESLRSGKTDNIFSTC